MRTVQVHLEFVHSEDEKPLSDDTSVLLGEMALEFQECLNLVLEKSEGYGNAWQEQGWMGNTARVLSKAARLKNMLWRDKTIHAREPVEETLRDLVNLAVFTLYNMRLGNRWGR